IADVNNAGILFSCADQNTRRFGGKAFQEWPCVLVGAMLAPHDRKNSQLGVTRLPTEDAFDSLVFLWREAVLLDKFRCNRLVRHVTGMIIEIGCAFKDEILYLHTCPAPQVIKAAAFDLLP